MPFSSESNSTRIHIRGPKPSQAYVGEGSSITCAINAPDIDYSFEMYINGDRYNNLNRTSPWRVANFTWSAYRESNGTVTTAIEGFVDSFTKEHDRTRIDCRSEKYMKKDFIYIRIKGYDQCLSCFHPNYFITNSLKRNCV